jgi:hypothetical protein
MKPTLLSSLAKTLPQSAPVMPAYRALHKYLVDRYAGVVVLTFAEVQDLIGAPLPDAARLESEWWADVRADGTSSDQSTAWTSAKRSATANVIAQKVTFKSVIA